MGGGTGTGVEIEEIRQLRIRDLRERILVRYGQKYRELGMKYHRKRNGGMIVGGLVYLAGVAGAVVGTVTNSDLSKYTGLAGTLLGAFGFLAYNADSTPSLKEINTEMYALVDKTIRLNRHVF